MTIGSGCRTAASGPASRVAPVGVGTLRQDSIALVRAVAREVAGQQRRLAVWPVFVSKTGEPAVDVTPSDSSRQRLVSNAFAEALGAPVVTLARSSESTPAGPDSTVGTIGIVAILLQPDSAYVDVTLLPSNGTMHGEWMFTAYRYHYRREQGRWSFVRREWLGSS